MAKGGRKSTSWQSGWRSGATTTVRVPIALVGEIMKYARELDNGDTRGDEEIILNAIDQYIEWKRQNYQPNQHSRKLNISTRAWDELRKFRKLIETSSCNSDNTNAVP